MTGYEGVAILGFPRSGTTLLRRILDAHSAVDCPGESHLLTAAAKSLDSYYVAGGVPVGVEAGVAMLGASPETLRRRLRNVVFSIRRERLQSIGKRVWAEKTAVDAFHVDAVDRLFGEHLAFIVVQRHGLDVAASVRDWCQKCEAHPPEIYAYIQRFERPLAAFAHAWVDVSAKLEEFALRRSDRTIRVRYEDFVGNPERVARRILAFLGLEWEEDLVGRALRSEPDGFGDWKCYATDRVSAEAVGRWKRLPSTTVGELAAICNPTLMRLGYDAAPTCPTPDPTEALRRYQLAQRFGRANADAPGP